MSNTYKTKKACKNKRLTGFLGEKGDAIPFRLGNQRKMRARMKVKDRRREKRNGRKELETEDKPRTKWKNSNIFGKC